MSEPYKLLELIEAIKTLAPIMMELLAITTVCMVAATICLAVVNRIRRRG